MTWRSLPSMAMLVLVFLCLVSRAFTQPPDFFGPPGPPWMGRPWRHHHHHHHGRPPWERPPWDRPPWMGPPPFFRPPPPPIMEPVLQDEVPVVTRPPVVAQPVVSVYKPEMQRMISNINSRSSFFSRPGQNYERVAAELKNLYTQRSGTNYDFKTLSIPQGSGELAANRQTAAILYETDVVLTLDQVRQIARSGGNRMRRMITADTSKRWPTNIPYRFADTDSAWQTGIRTVLSTISSSSCLRFVENGNGADYLIFDRNEGCHSPVGRLGGAQEVSIGYGCESDGIIAHEVGHALGLWHEQSRPDRDSFVRIYRQNAVKGTQAQFDKRTSSESSLYGVAYDYGSVMHYSANAFAASSTSNTIEPVDEVYRNTIGSRTSMSFLDMKVINMAYCQSSCRTSLPCQNGGYPHPNACNRCLCPAGLSGNFCSDLQYSAMGKDLTASYQWQEIRYNGAAEAFWRIKAPSGDKIRIELTNVYFKCAPTCEEFVEIKYGTTMDNTGYRLCCKAEFGQRVSKGNQVLVLARTTSSAQFTLKYKIEPGFHTVVTTTTRRPPPITAALIRRPPQRAPIRRVFTRTGTWSGWSAWSACTENCGACGTQERARRCTNGSCSGSIKQTKTCNQNACLPGTTRIRGRRSVLYNELVRHKRVTRNWCCAGYHLVNNNWCNHI